jgi:hypothetical protein
MDKLYRLRNENKAPPSLQGRWKILGRDEFHLVINLVNVDTDKFSAVRELGFSALFREIKEWEDSPLWRTLNEN